MTVNKSIVAIIVLALAALASVAAPASAQPADTPEGWQFEITPYFWVSGLKTDIKTPFCLSRARK